jgi:hypothetical protein
MRHLILPLIFMVLGLNIAAQNEGSGTSNKNVEPLKFFAYNDFLLSGVDHEIQIQSSNFANIINFQAGFRLKDAELVNVINGVLELANSHFYLPTEKALRTLWYETSIIPTTISPDKTIFKIRIKPSKSGYLSEFIRLDSTVMISEANYEDSNVADKILLEFSFPDRVSSSEEITQSVHLVNVYPNPSSGEYLNIKWNPELKPTKLNIYDILGRTILEKYIESPESGAIEIKFTESLSSGFYKIVLNNGPSHVTKAWIVR